MNLRESPIVRPDSTLYWKWQIRDRNDATFRDVRDYEVVNMHRGGFTNEMKLMLTGEQRVQKNCFFEIISYYEKIAEIKMHPLIPWVEMGYNDTDVRIGCSKGTFSGFYQFFFKAIFLLDEVFEVAYFDEPPPLDVEISENEMQINITTLNSTVYIPVGGISLPMVIDSRYFVPYQQTQVLAAYPIYPDIGADFAENAYFLYDIEHVFPFLLLRCYEQFNYLLTETTLSLSLGENDSHYYEIITENEKQSIDIKLIDEIVTPPLLNYTITTQPDISTEVYFEIKTNQSIFLYWSVSYSDYPSTNESYLD